MAIADHKCSLEQICAPAPREFQEPDEKIRRIFAEIAQETGLSDEGCMQGPGDGADQTILIYDKFSGPRRLF